MNRWKLTYRTKTGDQRRLIVVASSELNAWRMAIGYEDRTYKGLAVELVEIRWDGRPNLAVGHVAVQEVEKW